MRDWRRIYNSGVTAQYGSSAAKTAVMDSIKKGVCEFYLYFV